MDYVAFIKNVIHSYIESTDIEMTDETQTGLAQTIVDKLSGYYWSDIRNELLKLQREILCEGRWEN